MSNQREVEIRSGLKEGDRIVANPASLLGEDSEMRPGKSRTKHEEAMRTRATPRRNPARRRKHPP